jgi:hypothetical protein
MALAFLGIYDIRIELPGSEESTENHTPFARPGYGRSGRCQVFHFYPKICAGILVSLWQYIN